jgi:hypothetical protein
VANSIIFQMVFDGHFNRDDVGSSGKVNLNGHNVFHTDLNLSGFEPKSSSNKHFFQQFLSTSLGGIPAHELSNVSDSTVDTPLVLVRLGILGLVNETNLGFVDHQDVEVGK